MSESCAGGDFWLHGGETEVHVEQQGGEHSYLGKHCSKNALKTGLVQFNWN